MSGDGLLFRAPLTPERVMQNPKLLPHPLTFDCYPGGELRRRVADCRGRLRRNRAARRIAERANPHASDLPAEVTPAAHASAQRAEAGEET